MSKISMSKILMSKISMSNILTMKIYIREKFLWFREHFKYEFQK